MLHSIKSFSELQVGDKIWKKGPDLSSVYTVTSLDGGLIGFIYVKDSYGKRISICNTIFNEYDDEYNNYTYFKYDDIKDVYLACARWHQYIVDYWTKRANEN